MNRIARVPAVPHVLLDLRGIERQGFQLAVEHHAGLEPPGFEIALVAGELAEGHKVGRAADLGPVLVRAADKQQIRDVDLIHEVVDFARFRIRRCARRQAFVAGHAARHEELGVRVLRAEHRHGPRRLHLQPQGFKVMRRGDEIRFGIEVVGGMPAEEVGVGERAELPAFHKAFSFRLAPPGSRPPTRAGKTEEQIWRP